MNERQKALLEALDNRILVLDGAMGTMIQQQNLTAADFGGPAAWTGKCSFGAVAGLAAADGSVGVSVGCALATRGFFRSGLTCLATLSHSARSSSLKPRLRRG